jgi:signal transduction histidine kinase/ActR/RegA family two-component response regulator
MRLTIKQKLSTGFGILLLIFTVFGIVVLNNITRVQEQFSLVVKEDAPATAKANQLYRLVVDMETGQRGFCITQKEEFLEPYNSACDQFNDLMESLKELARHNPDQIKTLERIHRLVNQWQEEAAKPEIDMARRIGARRETNEYAESLKNLAALLETGTGKALLDKIRAEFGRFIKVEEEHCAQRYANSSHTTLHTKRITTWVVLFSIAFGSAVAALSIHVIISSVNRLVKGTKIIGAGDLKHRIEVKGEDEIGQLALTFNQMMDDIERETAGRKQAEQDLIETNRHLERQTILAKDMAAQAEMANKAKSEFLANMSHEIRTPMNSIMGFGDLLAEGDLSADQKDDVNIIREATKDLLNLIDDILDFSKIEAGQLEVNMTECPLGKMLSFLESMMKVQACKKSLDFRVMAGNDLPAHIQTDPFRLQQCLINLVGNAIKFTDQGHVHVKISHHVDRNKPFIHFDIEDTGIGIPQDRQQAIFESFTQADGSTTRKYGGTGLGLTVTKQLTGLLGGKLTLSSEAGKGSVFSLIIPANMDSADRLLPKQGNGLKQSVEESHIPEASTFSGNVLVAEDNETSQALMKLSLARMGLEVSIAKDGHQALKKASSSSFDLILMDIQMPHMNGYEVTRTLRQQGNDTPIVALTAKAMKNDKQNCLEAGCDDYLAKPINRRELRRVLAKYMSDRQDSYDKGNRLSTCT